MIDMIHAFSMSSRKLKKMTIGFLLLFSSTIFPLANFKMELFTFIMIAVFVELGILLASTFGPRKSKIIILLLSTNLVGLMIRIVFEWGESSLLRDLTPINIVTTYIPFCAIIYLSYYATIRSKQYMDAMMIEAYLINDNYGNK